MLGRNNSPKTQTTMEAQSKPLAGNTAPPKTAMF